MSTEFEKRYKLALLELKASKIKESNYLPAAHKKKRAQGVEERPPHYKSFKDIAVPLGLFFGPTWGLIMWFVSWRHNGGIVAAIITSIYAGVLYGCAMAYYYRHAATKHNLTPWEQLNIDDSA